mmetsp:Transcript_11075/g.32856  ORF Transcript_11075/g.32856 Transcript_11075/m.32856 type:complete len:123 (+) Transcript_11075:542-910(+)
MLCKDDCLESGSLAVVWLAQPSFQKYHGRAAISVAKDLFSGILSEGTFFNLAYFSVNNIAAFYLPNLDYMATTLLHLVANSSKDIAADGRRFDTNKGQVMVRLVNLLTGLGTFAIISKDGLP